VRRLSGLRRLRLRAPLLVAAATEAGDTAVGTGMVELAAEGGRAACAKSPLVFMIW
jgi:hypothetical protein